MYNNKKEFIKRMAKLWNEKKEEISKMFKHE